MLHYSPRVAALALAGLGFAANANAGIPVYNTIALSGSTGVSLGFGPNQGPGLTFNVFNPPVLNQAGAVAFQATLAGPGMTHVNDDGIWTKAGGTLTTVARAGSAGPGPGLGAGIEFWGLGSPNINSAGRVAFGGLLMGPGVTSDNDAFHASTVDGSLALYAREGGATLGPGLGAGVEFSTLDMQQINDAGKTAFLGTLKGTGVDLTNNRGIFTRSPGGAPVVVARSGSSGPGPNVGAGVNFDVLSFFPLINPNGRVAFFATVTGPGINSSNNMGIWTNTTGTLAPAARTGNTGPGPNVGAGVHFSNFDGRGFNAAGQVVFEGFLTGAGIDATNDRGVWTGAAGGTPSVVARSGPAGPGPNSGAGINFADFEDPVINANGHVAFRGFLTGPGIPPAQNDGLWTNSGGSLSAVARSGTTGPLGPGAGPGVVFNSLGAPTLNSHGHIAFSATLTGAGVTTANDRGIWTNAAGSLVKVVREGELFDVDPGPGVVLRTISDFSFGNPSQEVAGGQDGLYMSFNDNGLLTFSLAFTDGSSGVFTAFVPEPSGLLLLLAPTAAVALRRRRRA